MLPNHICQSTMHGHEDTHTAGNAVACTFSHHPSSATTVYTGSQLFPGLLIRAALSRVRMTGLLQGKCQQSWSCSRQLWSLPTVEET